MPVHLEALLSPKTCALVTQECQNGVIGPQSALPELAANAQGGMIDAISKLVAVGRTAGVQVIHCLAARRRDGRGSNTNGRLFHYMAQPGLALYEGTEAAQLVPEISTDERDITLTRLHGLSPFEGSELDSILRNLGVRTIVAVGVSVNIAIQNLTFDAVNAAYQVVIPRDAVTGFPLDYVEQVLEHSLGGISTIVDTERVCAAWEHAAS